MPNQKVCRYSASTLPSSRVNDKTQLYARINSALYASQIEALAAAARLTPLEGGGVPWVSRRPLELAMARSGKPQAPVPKSSIEGLIREGKLVRPSSILHAPAVAHKLVGRHYQSCWCGHRSDPWPVPLSGDRNFLHSSHPDALSGGLHASVCQQRQADAHTHNRFSP
ncbi:hypothetical protein M440DRAFT_1125673 [Trichoderma longibrachiatum ATCC 18648]|uniref:Uncharacterized protein n=1 Tax=Trichoderma longibrachiatum ATCC 18648 TaxID=983965 RepID=A0A2T4CFV5_TRILO|nr:hypothetical protein M440DRAFT_1125673 [Trichoderma longibrachiatum ATCC 18648]